MLNKGDTIGIIALSGNCCKEKIELAKTNIETFGFKVKLSKNIYAQNRYLAGSDEEKINELHRFFRDDEIKLILCARGGYGAIRLINGIDYDLIKSNPKMFCGFSDATALLLMIYRKTGLVTYHGPMACTDFVSDKNSASLPLVGEGQGEGSTLQTFFKAINDERLRFEGTKIYKEGTAEGILWGGNLSTVVSLCGQDFIPDNDFIFFAEDLNEPVYKIDKMFQQLINIPKFIQHCKGIILGDFLDVDNEKWLDDYFKELAEILNIPVTSGFKITHDEEKITLPIGKTAKLKAKVLTVFNK